jgi:hypothetical protein
MLRPNDSVGAGGTEKSRLEPDPEGIAHSTLGSRESATTSRCLVSSLLCRDAVTPRRDRLMLMAEHEFFQPSGIA